jgi:hypothetical protein
MMMLVLITQSERVIWHVIECWIRCAKNEYETEAVLSHVLEQSIVQFYICHESKHLHKQDRTCGGHLLQYIYSF